MPKKTPNEPKLEPAYTLVIRLGENTLKGEGTTMLEALESIKRPTKIFTKGIISAKGKDKSLETTWPCFRVKRLFYPLAQGYLSKQLEYLLR